MLFRYDYLTPLYAGLLKTVMEHPEQQSQYAAANNIRSMQMSAICSHLTRRGYVIEKGVFRRKLRITEKGTTAVKKYC